MSRAGRISTRSRASTSPSFANEWATPGGISMTSPGPACRVRRPTRKRIRPSTTSKRSVWIGWTWGTGTDPPGRSAKSNASSSPPVEAAVSVNLKRSPVTGFSSDRRPRGWVCVRQSKARSVRLSIARSRKSMFHRLRFAAWMRSPDCSTGPRAREAFLLRSTLAPPWALRIEDEAPLTVVAVVRGSAWVLPDEGEPCGCGPGDVAVAARARPLHGRRRPGDRAQVLIGPGQVCTTPDGAEARADGSDARHPHAGATRPTARR